VQSSSFGTGGVSIRPDGGGQVCWPKGNSRQIRGEAGLAKLMIGATRFLFLCAAVLALPTYAAAQPTPLAPGWYRNSGPSVIYEDSELTIIWENSYIYPYPGNDPLYWYAEVVYFYNGNQTFNIRCAGEDEFPPVKEHMRGTANAGYVEAEETLCSRNPDFTITLQPGEAFSNWVIFHNVPWPGSEVSLEWEPYGFSEWVDPWYSPFNAPPPAECPPELVTLGTCQLAEPGPQWITPHDGATVPYPNDLVFEVTPVDGAVGYFYGFKEKGQFVWGNWSHEQRLDGTQYILPRGSPGHLALGFGADGQTSWPLQVWVRAYIRDGDQYHWTEASIINITLVGFGCIYGPGATCIDVLNPIPPNQWPSPDEVRAQLINIGMGTLCLGEILALYVASGPVGVVMGLPFIITPGSPCADPELVNEIYTQVMALFACIPSYGWEVCLPP
jgi:hypothetical protein